MGLGNFLKRQVGIGKLPKSQLNATTVVNILKNGAPFIVVLPIFDTVKFGSGIRLTQSTGDGNYIGSYTPAPSIKQQRKILKNIKYTNNTLTIIHAQNNGAHIFIKAKDMAYVYKLTNGIMIELVSGIQYQFLMNKNIKNQWKTLGFKPEFVIDVFYQMITKGFQTPARTVNNQDSIPSNPIIDKNFLNDKQEKQKEIKEPEHALNKKRKNDLKRLRNKCKSNKVKAEYDLKIPCPICGKMIKDKAVRCKYCKTNLNEYKATPEYKEKIRELKKIQYNKIVESKKQGKSLKSCPNCGEKIPLNAIRCKYCKTILQEYNSNKSNKKKTNIPNKYNGLNRYNLPQYKKSEISNNEKIEPEENLQYNEDDSPFEKIKQAKELFDIGAITQEEYDKIKTKYIDKL